MKEQALEKIADKSAVVGIIGLGYVGLPLALCFIEKGYRVIGFDSDPQKVELLNDGRSYIKHVGIHRVQAAKESGLFTATSDYSKAEEADALILCVPTPLGKHMEPDVSYIISTVAGILPYVRKGQLVSLESTTYPGTTEDLIAAPIEAKGFKVGRDVFVAFSPEREDPGNPDFSTSTIPKLVGGCSEACLEVALALYSNVVVKAIPVSSTRVAETAKLLENIFRSVNIGLVNEMKIVCDKLGIDVWDVIDAAATKPFGFMAFRPGPGMGGHCIPIDPFYLTWKAKEFGINTHFIELAGTINNSMPDWVVQKTALALNDHGKSVKGSKVLVLGLAYKKNIDDLRESPSIHIIERLMALGAQVGYSDPHIPRTHKMREHDLDLSSIELTPSVIAKQDCVLVATDHDAFDYAMIERHAKLIVDTRGVYRGDRKNVVKA